MKLTQFLDSLKLTIYEKEIINYLASVDAADAKIIYKNIRVPQGRIYSVLNELNHKGIINIIPTSPKKYQIKDIKISLKNYINKSKYDLDEKISLVENLEIKPKIFNLEKNDPSVNIFTGVDEHLNAIITLRDSAKEELLQIAPLFRGTFASNLSLQNSLKRGIVVKIIVSKITNENKKNIIDCIKLGAEVRQLNSFDLLSTLIKDSSEFLLGVENYKNKEERINLFSKNQALLLTLRQTFFNLWKNAKLITNKDIKL